LDLELCFRQVASTLLTRRATELPILCLIGVTATRVRQLAQTLRTDGPTPEPYELAWLSRRSKKLVRICIHRNIYVACPPSLSVAPRCVSNANIVTLSLSTHHDAVISETGPSCEDRPLLHKDKCGRGYAYSGSH